ncbi:MAG: [FeFe] hydrogenase H-cluster radical SAM maturase HydG [Spirochaetes bacterium]|nr:[FeFe] hydrogenase H-cluster radical SAM maturase HydG [Spirochaetota bacterium]
MMIQQAGKASFIDAAAIRGRLAHGAAGVKRVREILQKARLLQGLNREELADLALLDDPALEAELFAAAGWVKEQIYGRRMVIFAPLYIGNKCSNNCLYCAFRSANTDLVRRSLSFEEIENETRALLREGHKRVLMLSGEDATESLDRFIEAIRRVYAVREKNPRNGVEANIRRINVEIAPLTEDGFRRLKAAGIGTYACFQETYDPDLYAQYHLSGPKADYLDRLYVMDRAMAGGIDDVGIGALFGLGDWRFELLALYDHAAHLEQSFGCGPHTVSVPRIEPADGAPAALSVPQAVSDRDFRKIIAILRLALPYTGIILSTRESEELRNELFTYGISQISAGSRTNPGAYAEDAANTAMTAAAHINTATAAHAPAAHATTAAQFQLGDHRSLEEISRRLAKLNYVPSFCTGCYRKGRVGADFMDLAKPGLIKCYCEPNAYFTYSEYLADFASAETRGIGNDLVRRLAADSPAEIQESVKSGLERIQAGERDVYL